MMRAFSPFAGIAAVHGATPHAGMKQAFGPAECESAPLWLRLCRARFIGVHSWFRFVLAQAARGDSTRRDVRWLRRSASSPAGTAPLGAAIRCGRSQSEIG